MSAGVVKMVSAHSCNVPNIRFAIPGTPISPVPSTLINAICSILLNAHTTLSRSNADDGDIAAAVAVGATPVMVRTGHGARHLDDADHRASLEAVHVEDDLRGAVRWILDREERS